MNKRSAIVLGAGISGLLIARSLATHGIKVTVVDKGRGVGGRMATRRFAGGRVDHGAQYFTVRGENMKSLIALPDVKQVVRVWSKGFPSHDNPLNEDGFPRFMAVDGMSSLPKALAHGLSIKTSTRISSISRKNDFWELKSEDASTLICDILIITSPAEQTLALFDMGDTSLKPDERNLLESIQYNPCYALMVRLATPGQVPKPGGIHLQGEPIAWIADNSQKGLPHENYHQSLITIHSGPEFAREYWDADQVDVTRVLLDHAKPFLSSSVLESRPHRWKYAQSLQRIEPGYLQLDSSAPCFIAGDGLGGGKIEGAVDSAAATIKAFQSLL